MAAFPAAGGGVADLTNLSLALLSFADDLLFLITGENCGKINKPYCINKRGNRFMGIIRKIKTIIQDSQTARAALLREAEATNALLQMQNELLFSLIKTIEQKNSKE